MSFATVPLPATWAAQPKVLRGHEKLDCLAIGPNGRTVVTGSLLDKTARVWDLSAADPAAKPKVLGGHDNGLRCLAISRDGKTLVTGSRDGPARVWDLSDFLLGRETGED